MSRKDKPYLPLYVQDFMTDERLMECSASATGVYVRIMCVLHKSETYGKILLKQKDKQKDKQISNFALKFAKHFPYDFDTILLGITELVDEGCLTIEGDFLYQKRMVMDGNLSTTRSETGSKGGKVTQSNNKEFAKAKIKANTDIDIVVYNILYKVLESNNKLIAENDLKDLTMIVKDMLAVWLKYKPHYSVIIDVDYHALLQIAYHIADRKKWRHHEVIKVGIVQWNCTESWEKIVQWLTTDKNSEYYKTMPLDKICTPKGFRDIEERMKTKSVIAESNLKKLEEGRIDQETYMNG
jgi:hypothetical protein